MCVCVHGCVYVYVSVCARRGAELRARGGPAAVVCACVCVCVCACVYVYVSVCARHGAELRARGGDRKSVV